MKYKYHLIYSFLILFSVTNRIIAQSIPDSFKANSLKIEVASDSLLNKSFKELKSSFYKSQQDSKISSQIATHYLIKAKKKLDTIEIANGYHLLSKANKNNISSKYLDSMIFITKNIKDLSFPAQAYLRKGSYFAIKGDYNLALNNYLIARKLAKERKNHLQLLTIHQGIAMLKKTSGLESEALSALKKNLLFFSNEKPQKEHLGAYLSTLISISDSYLRQKKADSSEYYIEEGLHKSINYEKQGVYNTFLLLHGIKNRMQGNYQIALDTLLKCKKRMNLMDIEDANKRITDLQISKVLLKLERDKEAIIYLRDISAATNAKNFSPDESDTFSLLIDYYKKSGDLKNQLKTLNKLITLDSVFRAKNKNIRTNIIKKYDTPLLIEEREVIIEELEKEKSYSYIGVVVLLMISSVSIFLMLNYRKKQKIFKKRFLDLIDKKESILVKEIDNTLSNNNDDIDLSDDLINSILKALTDFESRKGFLSSNLDLNTFAKELETNKTYLSKIVNNYKNKNFTNYINDLRIDYCVEKLKSDTTFRKYSIKAIAKEVGFSSTQSFSRAFLKKTGLQTSYFLKNLTIS